jgi:hypothetical protein
VAFVQFVVENETEKTTNRANDPNEAKKEAKIVESYPPERTIRFKGTRVE